jgi:hypothetical protein
MVKKFIMVLANLALAGLLIITLSLTPFDIWNSSEGTVPSSLDIAYIDKAAGESSKDYSDFLQDAKGCESGRVSLFWIWFKFQLENEVKGIVERNRAEGRNSYLTCSIMEFLQADPDSASALIIRNSSDGVSMTVHFQLRRRSILTTVLPAPGASNGHLSAILRQNVGGGLVLIKRGGDEEWL